MTEEAQKTVVLRAVEAAILIRRDGHRYPECITVGELLQAHPELHRADVVAVLKDLQSRGAVALRPAINDLTIYLNDEKA